MIERSLRQSLLFLIIVKRLAEGKAVATLNPNFKEGRPNKFTNKQIVHGMKFLEQNHSLTRKRLQG